VLAISHNIVVGQHHGRILFEVDEGIGTVFKILLPLTAERSAQRNVEGEAGSIDTEARTASS